jgi:glutamyl-tRNA synthetase
MKVTVRFAPSPTGMIHIGNARTALFNWLFALKHRGRFIQRFDDTDAARSSQRFANGILYDLHWLGIFPDQIEYQSKRFDRYHAAVDRLKAAGLVYACYETQEELDLRRASRAARKLPPVYGREALELTAEQVAAFEADGRKPHWRFLLPNFGTGKPSEPVRTEVTWQDLIRGEEVVDLASVSDPVILREDGTFLYTLTSVVDDIEMGVTHIFRGDDHVTNTGVQIALFKALGAEPPAFGHHNLLTTSTGEGLSKRSGALSVASLREDGFEPMALSSLAVRLGTSEAVAPAFSMAELAAEFDPATASKSAAKFDPADLKALNAPLVHRMDYAQARDRLAILGILGERAERFWTVVRNNIQLLPEAAEWWTILRKGPNPRREFDEADTEFLRLAFDKLPAGPFDETSWKAWFVAIRAESERKGKALARPIRLALTGQESGPELADLLPLLDPEEIRARRP